MLIPFGFLLVLAALFGGIYWLVLYYFKGNPRKTQKENETINQILKLLRNEKTASKRVTIIESLDISPKVFRQLLEKMLNLDLIRHTPDTVKITEFGKHYYDNFILNKR